LNKVFARLKKADTTRFVGFAVPVMDITHWYNYENWKLSFL